jgi:hypothetical protein
MDLHEPELMVLRKGFARVMTAAEILEHWNGDGKPTVHM